MSELYSEEKQVEGQLRRIEALVRTIEHQTGRWSKLVKKVADALKELGDVANWVQLMQEEDVSLIEREIHAAVENRAL